MRLVSRDLLVPTYAIGILGAFIQIAGGYWDVSWHVLRLVETFFTPAHTVLYTGVVLVLVASILGLFMRFRVFTNQDQERHLLTGLLVVALGSGLQLIAAPFDFWWHSNFGFDPFLFTPAHSLLIAGIILNGIGMSLGSVRLLQAYRAGTSLGRFFVTSKWLQLLVVVALTTLWLDLNTLVYLVTDVNGIAYTLHLGNDFVTQTSAMAFAASVTTLAATGTLVFFTAKKMLAWRGAVTSVALLSAGLSATANLGFRAFVLAGKTIEPSTYGGVGEGSVISSFIPLYVSFVVPVFLFDVLVKDSQSGWRMILAAALVGPFASFLDGWYALPLWMRFSQLIPTLIVPMIVAGLIAGLSRVRFANVLLSRKMITTTQPR